MWNMAVLELMTYRCMDVRCAYVHDEQIQHTQCLGEHQLQELYRVLNRSPCSTRTCHEFCTSIDMNIMLQCGMRIGLPSGGGARQPGSGPGSSARMFWKWSVHLRAARQLIDIT